jgi:hypothetical protein
VDLAAAAAAGSSIVVLEVTSTITNFNTASSFQFAIVVFIST